MTSADAPISDPSIEQEIIAKALTAPRVTPEHIASVIVQDFYIQPYETTLTICILKLQNGTLITGESACVSAANFDAELGRKIARQKAVEKIWALEGYLLAERQNAARHDVPPPPGEIEFIARICHEVNRAYCWALGDNTQLPWSQAPEWQRQSAMTGVKLHVADPDAGPQASHESWMREKLEQGWQFGAVKDPEAKTHPCLVPFELLPREQQAKDFIFRGVVLALSHNHG